MAKKSIDELVVLFYGKDWQKRIPSSLREREKGMTRKAMAIHLVNLAIRGQGSDRIIEEASSKTYDDDTNVFPTD